MSRRSVQGEAPGGTLAGWVQGTGAPVLLLHGGPGLSYEYLDLLAAELGDGYRIAGFQQRGLTPSTVEGPFTVEQAVADVGSFLDALGWDGAVVVGHSWGGHLLFHLAVSTPQRLVGGLAVDPLGAVGDGGLATMAAEMAARVPPSDEADDESLMEGLRRIWPAYFARPADAPAMPADLRGSEEAYAGLFGSLVAEMEGLARALPAVRVPFGFVAGAQSPLPVDEGSRATAAVIPGAWLDVVEDAGHFPWLEQPGRVQAALARLVDQVEPSGGWENHRP